MLLADLLFHPAAASSDEERAEFRGVAESFLSALEKNGNLNGEYVFDWTSDHLRATAYAASEEALESKAYSTSVEEAYAVVLQCSTRPPTLEVVGIGKRRVRWDNAAALYLFTHALDRASPVCAGDDGSPIPLYALPISERDREDLCSWASAYRHHDMIALLCGDLEIPAYRQLADPESGLSRTGRQLCQTIETATGLPTYQYLHRYWGRRSEVEVSRSCPGCGASWKKDAGEGHGLAWFDFLCSGCRIVSNVAASFDSKERLARIGEFSPRRKVRAHKSEDR